ncbi:hypothetical protein PRIPAC_86032 [Pristionchus pacificus]|uniref:Uncharacterized protein n=1 Tax=Pristionchus pacificus TaxID=54126 RepID=A0A2A6BMK7_PRIPA|nr:hypothetical protein PRIPAC_86032 [Pristionchus pacificus]|eukprot:PDM67125.1 hypothetical protein PRIPAC_48542 [Pristionchus pacificus]
MATWYGIVLVVALCLLIIGLVVLLCFRQCFRRKRNDDVVESEEGRSRFVFTIPMTVSSKRSSNISAKLTSTPKSSLECPE